MLANAWRARYVKNYYEAVKDAVRCAAVEDILDRLTHCLPTMKIMATMRLERNGLDPKHTRKHNISPLDEHLYLKSVTKNLQIRDLPLLNTTHAVDNELIGPFKAWMLSTKKDKVVPMDVDVKEIRVCSIN